MKAEVRVLVDRADESMRAPRRLLEEALHAPAASLAYYAMYHIASAALLTRGLRFKRHASLIRAFADQFVKTEALPRDVQSKLGAAFLERIRSDYRVLEEVTREEAETQLKRAEEFVNAVKAFLGKESEL